VVARHEAELFDFEKKLQEQVCGNKPLGYLPIIVINSD
jgi:hypothetical protein